MRVLLLSPSFHPAVGGIERFAEALATWLAHTGHDVTVATPTPHEGPHDLAQPYAILRSPSPFAVARAARRADVVHSKSLSVRASSLALAAGRRPVVTHGGHQAICPVGIAWGHGGACFAGPARPGPCSACFRQGARARATIAAQRAAAASAAVNVCPSRYLGDRLGVPRTTMIPNPVAGDAGHRFEQHVDALGLAQTPREDDEPVLRRVADVVEPFAGHGML